MQNSNLGSLAAFLPASAIQGIAKHLGASEGAVSGGIQASLAAVISGLSQRSNDQGFLSQIMQMAKGAPENAVTSALTNGSLTNATSEFLTGGKQFLSTVFGGKLESLIETLSSQTGLRTAAASTLLALGGQTVLGFLGSKVRDGSLTASSLPALLAGESKVLAGALPAGFPKQPLPGGTTKVDVNPVVAQTVQKEGGRSILPWLLGLLLAVLLLGFWWYRSHQQPVAETQPQQQAVPAPVAANATSSTGADLGAMMDATLPDGTTLHIPDHGVEGKLLAFIKDPSHTPDKTSWFDFDRLLFTTGSATLEPQSTEQLNNIAAILKGYPAVHLNIGGYTDNTGNAAKNVKLSQDRADSVASQLETMGVARNRLVAKGYGDQHPVGDNSTEEGRAQNRRISMLVTAK